MLVCLEIVRGDPCYISRKWGDGGPGTLAGYEKFNVAANAQTTCKTECDSYNGGVWSLFLEYGQAANVVNNDGSDVSNDDGCNMEVTIASTREEFNLGYQFNLIAAGAANYTNLRLTCTCTQEGDGPSNPCFSESAMAETQNKGIVTMKDLQTGDMVFSGHDRKGKPRYQPVYSFGQYHPTLSATFIQIYTAQMKDPLEMTEDHLVYVIAEDGKERFVRADTVQVGDLLLQEQSILRVPFASFSQVSPITKIATVDKQGIYMPLTPDGTLFVNGVKVSSYVSLNKLAPKGCRDSLLLGVTSRDLQHWWLAPHRMLCMGVSSVFCASKDSNSFNNNQEGMFNWLYYAKRLILYAEERSWFVRIVVIGGPLFALFALFNSLELLFGASWTPAVLLLGAVMAWYRFHRGRRERSFGKQLYEIRDRLAEKPNKKDI